MADRIGAAVLPAADALRENASPQAYALAQLTIGLLMQELYFNLVHPLDEAFPGTLPAHYRGEEQ